MDADGNGMIAYSEFINIALEKKKLMSKENLKITFKSLDINNDGFLSIDEIKAAFSSAGNEKT